MSSFKDFWESISMRINCNAHAKGFYDPPRSFGETIALIHSELSEALEGYRHGNPKSEHIPDYTAIEEELADVVIRLMDESHNGGHRVVDAMFAKMLFNEGRPHKHGGKVI